MSLRRRTPLSGATQAHSWARQLKAVLSSKLYTGTCIATQAFHSTSCRRRLVIKGPLKDAFGLSLNDTLLIRGLRFDCRRSAEAGTNASCDAFAMTCGCADAPCNASGRGLAEREEDATALPARGTPVCLQSRAEGVCVCMMQEHIIIEYGNIHILNYIYTHICMCVYDCVCMYACMYVWTCVRMYACMHACMYVCACVSVGERDIESL